MTIERLQEIINDICKCEKPIAVPGFRRCYQCGDMVMTSIELELMEVIDKLTMSLKFLEKNGIITINDLDDVRIILRQC